MNYSITKDYPVFLNYGDTTSGFNYNVFGKNTCWVYLFDGSNSDYLEIGSYTGNLKIILAATSETGIPAAIVAGRQGGFTPSIDPVNDPQWVQYEIDGVIPVILLEATFTGVCGRYAKDNVWYLIDGG